jgi:hypothetical protein
MASLRSPPLYSSKRVIGLPTLPFTTVEDDPYIAPAPKLPEQLLVSVQTGAGHDEEEHVADPTTDLKMARGGSQRAYLSFFRGCVYLHSLILALDLVMGDRWEIHTTPDF